MAAAHPYRCPPSPFRARLPGMKHREVIVIGAALLPGKVS
jgi:hypothetical protein